MEKAKNSIVLSEDEYDKLIFTIDKQSVRIQELQKEIQILQDTIMTILKH